MLQKTLFYFSIGIYYPLLYSIPTFSVNYNYLLSYNHGFITNTQNCIVPSSTLADMENRQKRHLSPSTPWKPNRSLVAHPNWSTSHQQVYWSWLLLCQELNFVDFSVCQVQTSSNWLPSPKRKNHQKPWKKYEAVCLRSFGWLEEEGVFSNSKILKAAFSLRLGATRRSSWT